MKSPHSELNDKNNYRPISILPVLSKVLERCVHMHFSTFLEGNNLITLVQSGFRHMHSTLTSLINITDRSLRNIDQGLVTGIVFIDLQKAFDTLNFEIFLKILKYYGVSDVELKWFTSYLHGRMHSSNKWQSLRFTTCYSRSATRKHSWTTDIHIICE